MKLWHWLVTWWFSVLCRMGFHRFEYSMDPALSHPDRAQIHCERCGANRPDCAVTTRTAVDAHIRSNEKASKDPEYKRRWSLFKSNDADWDSHQAA